MELYLCKTSNGHYIPAYDSDKEKSDSISPGEIVACKVRRPRNILHHRKYFALLKLTMSNLPEHLEEAIRSDEDLLTEIKMQLGYREKRRSLGGAEYYVPKSISFLKMDQDEFNDFYSRSLDLILKYILPGCERADLEQELASFL